MEPGRQVRISQAFYGIKMKDMLSNKGNQSKNKNRFSILPRHGFSPCVSLPGLLIQQVIFFICSVGFTFLFIIPLQSGTNTYLFKIIQNMW